MQQTLTRTCCLVVGHSDYSSVSQHRNTRHTLGRRAAYLRKREKSAERGERQYGFAGEYCSRSRCLGNGCTGHRSVVLLLKRLHYYISYLTIIIEHEHRLQSFCLSRDLCTRTSNLEESRDREHSRLFVLNPLRAASKQVMPNTHTPPAHTYRLLASPFAGCSNIEWR